MKFLKFFMLRELRTPNPNNSIYLIKSLSSTSRAYMRNFSLFSFFLKCPFQDFLILMENSPKFQGFANFKKSVPNSLGSLLLGNQEKLTLNLWWPHFPQKSYINYCQFTCINSLKNLLHFSLKGRTKGWH